MPSSQSGERGQILELFSQRERQCRVERRAYEIWLGRLTPLKWVTTGGGTLLSILAGATVLGQPKFFGSAWPVYGGALALTSSVLTGLHTALRCDSHQTECHRLINLYSSLEAAFQAARVLPAPQLEAPLKELEGKFEEARMKAAAHAPAWCRRRAQREDSS